MVRLLWLLIGLALLGLAGCGRASRLVDEWRGRRPLEAFRRERFETFESDETLARFLDAAAYVAEHSRGAAAPTPPRDMPSRAQPPGSSVNMRGWRPLIGGFSRAFRRERAERIAVRDGFVFVLYGNQLRSFAIDEQSKQLEQRGSLRLGEAVHAPRIEQRPGNYDAESGVTNSNESLAQTRVYSRVFATEHELIVVGSLQHRSALEILRIRVGARGELERGDATWIHFRELGSDGYRARLIGQKLVIYVAHDPVYGHVYTLPGIGPDEEDAQPRVLLHGRQVYRPLVNVLDVRLHMIVSCDLTVGPLVCDAQAVFGPDAEAMMGSDAAYLLLAETDFFGRLTGPSVLTRLPYDGSPPTGVRVQGAVRISSDEPMHEKQGRLYTLLERGQQIELLDVPLALLAAAPVLVPDDSSHPVTRVAASDSVTFSAYVGDYVIADERTSKDSVRFVRLADARSFVVKLDYQADHALDLGDHALLMGGDARGLHFSVVSVHDESPRVVASYVMQGDAQNIGAYGAPRVLGTDVDATWAQVELPGPPTTLLPLRFSRAAASLEAAPTLTFDSARPPYSIDVASLGTSIIALRAENQLLVQHLTQPPSTLQRIPLDR